ncbi:MAG: MauE/DoxX family redox-associated membrane protein [Mycobacteriaceae bacterium]
MRWFGLLARLVVGGVWIVAGVLKLPDPTENVRAVRAYELLPESIVPVVGHGLPILEILVGTCLVLGVLTRVIGVLSGLMLLAFIIGISSAWARGLQIECGCFGGGAGPTVNATAKYPWEIARDVGLLLLSAFLVWQPRTRWSVDNRLLPELSPE